MNLDLHVSSKPLAHSARPPAKNMVWIPGGTFNMGANNPEYPEEGPIQTVSVNGFWIDRYLVTNQQFQKFVKETGYVTFAEKAPHAADYPEADPQMLVAGSAVFIKPTHPVPLQPSSWWQYIPGANWRHPEGPKSSIKKRRNHPVVHLVYEDVLAYAEWIGKQLPTEAQWEFAARGGLKDTTFSWGNELLPNGRIMANIWQGQFPWQHLRSTTPGAEAIGSYPPNGYGLYDMIGNVWEWTNDWYQERHGGKSRKGKGCCDRLEPSGGSETDSYDLQISPLMQKPRKVIKGGSFLCAPNYCARYRPAARHPEDIDTSTNHLGFRLVISPS